MDKIKYPTDVAQLDDELKQLFKKEYLKKGLERFCLLYSQIGDIFHYLTHDQEFNPPARPWGSKEDHKSILAQVLMQLLMTYSAVGLNFKNVFRDALVLPKNSNSKLHIKWIDDQITTWEIPRGLEALRNACLDIVANTTNFLEIYKRDGFGDLNRPDGRALLCAANTLRSLFIVILSYNYTVQEILQLGLDNQRSLDWAKKESSSSDDGAIVGLVAMSGTVRGRAYVVSKDNPLDDLPARGWILVIQHAKPDYALAFKYVLGVVTDNGGKTCHAANYARENNIPCVVGTGNATKKIPHGKVILIEAESAKEGDKGRITLLD